MRWSSERARLIAAVPAGRMLAVAARRGADRAALAAARPRWTSPRRNGPSMTVLSGPPAEIEARGRPAGRRRHRLPARCAPRTPSTPRCCSPPGRSSPPCSTPVPRRAPSVTDRLQPHRRARSPPSRPPDPSTGPTTWSARSGSPTACRHCVSQGVDAFVELGARPDARRAGPAEPGRRRHGRRPRHPAGPLDRRAAPPTRTTSCSRPAAGCGSSGAELDWEPVRRAAGCSALPTYPFQRTRFWPERTVPGQDRPTPAPGARARRLRPSPTPGGRTRREAPPPPPSSWPGPLRRLRRRPAAWAPPLADLAAAAGHARGRGASPGDGPPRREGRRVTIDPADPDHYADVLATCDRRTATARSGSPTCGACRRAAGPLTRGLTPGLNGTSCDDGPRWRSPRLRQPAAGPPGARRPARPTAGCGC